MGTTQKGVLLGPSFSFLDIEVAKPPSTRIDPHSYRDLLPGCSSGPLRCIIAPFTQLTGSPIAVVFRDAPLFSVPGNPAATRLTASLESGFGYEVLGPALAFYTEPGKGFTLDDWGELDNVISGPFMALFESGEQPSKAELQQIADDYKAGLYKQQDSEGDDYADWT